jgi:HK97 family phage major capsid protein
MHPHNIQRYFVITTLPEIEKIRTLYAEAVATSRDESAETDTRSRALDDAVKLRARLDEALVELARQREVDEARGAMFAGGTIGRTARPEDAQLRELVRPVDTTQPMMQSAVLPLAELRTEYPFAVGDSSHTYGSYAVPTTLYGAVIAGLLDESAVLQAGPMMVPTQSGEPLTIPVLGTDASADYRAEGTPATQSTPVLGKTALTAYNLCRRSTNRVALRTTKRVA